MKQKIKTNTGKEIDLPARIFTKKDLKNMGLDFVKNKVFFNKSKHNQDFDNPSSDIKKNMSIINYPDCSAIEFSEDILKEKIRQQKNSDSDFIILPYFRNETDYDIKIKIDYAEDLKLSEDINKDIILELSYKSNIPAKELIDLSPNFDYLSIFYGCSYGHAPSFNKVIKKVALFKAFTGKKVLCTAIPIKFSGDTNEDCRFMPCFSLICDMWIKNWRAAGGGNKIKVTDPQDLKSKDYTLWLESGYTPNKILPLIKRTVYDLFSEDNSGAREEFEKYVLDEVLSEIDNLTPNTIEDYIYQKFHAIYCVPILIAYKEKIISVLFKENKLFKKYEESELRLLEMKIRKYYSPLKVEKLIVFLISLVEKDTKIPIAQLIKNADNFEIGRY